MPGIAEKIGRKWLTADEISRKAGIKPKRVKYFLRKLRKKGCLVKVRPHLPDMRKKEYLIIFPEDFTEKY